jgi:hypothetical protein
VTAAPEEPIVRAAVPTEQEELVVVVVEPLVVVIEVPLRAAWTFAIVALFAPNEERSERID